MPTVTALGSYSCYVSGITVTAAGGASIAHGLPSAAGQFYEVTVRTKGTAGNTSLGGGLTVTDVDETNVDFGNSSGQTINGAAHVRFIHSIIR